MKYLKKILNLLVICILFIPSVYADSDKNLVNIYLFYSDSCPHCAKEKVLLKELEDKYDNIKVHKYEVNTDNNMDILFGIADIFDTFAGSEATCETELENLKFIIKNSEVTKEYQFTIGPFDLELVKAGGWVEYADKKY